MTGMRRFRDGGTLCRKSRGIAHEHAVPLAPSMVWVATCPPSGAHERILHIHHVEPEAGSRGAVDLDVEVVAARAALCHALRVPAPRAAGLDLGADPLQLVQIRAEHLHTDRRAHAGREHVDAVLDGHRPEVGHTRHPRGRVQLGTRLSYVRPGATPFSGFRFTTVSNMSSGAGSVAVVARPALPITLSTSGNARDDGVLPAHDLCACWIDTPGSVMGMKRMVPSSTGGMNSDPSRRTGHRQHQQRPRSA
jgi:hypothetical protein